MLGRAAYHTPGILAEADLRVYGASTEPIDFAAVIDTMAAYAARHIERGGRLGHVTRHMVGLFHGLPGARRYRQIFRPTRQGLERARRYCMPPLRRLISGQAARPPDRHGSKFQTPILPPPVW